jgi:ribosomal-protein-alanine N-acetyltransferase
VTCRKNPEGVIVLITETSRLRIRELTVEDAEFIFGLVNEPSFLTNIGDKGVRNLDDARKFILEGPWASHRERGYGQFMVELKEDGVPIGVCGILFRDALELSDIGCAFLPEYWRRGFAYEAACAVMNFGRSTLGLETIAGLTSEANLASIKLLEKLGMSFERTIKMSDDDPGTALYSRKEF